MSGDSNEFLGEFKLNRRQVSFKLDGADYYIQEMTSKERDRYLNRVTSRSKRSRGGKQKFDFDGIQAELLSRCVFKADGNVPMKPEEFDSWPAGMSQAIFDKAMELNGLSVDSDDALTEAAKNV